MDFQQEMYKNSPKGSIMVFIFILFKETRNSKTIITGHHEYKKTMESENN